jgi:hypothetical protein
MERKSHERLTLFMQLLLLHQLLLLLPLVAWTSIP